MTVRWSPEATADFAAIVEYIRNQNPAAGAACGREVARLVTLAKVAKPGAPVTGTTPYGVARVLKYVAVAWL